ncbi:unnamed protein product [Mytilus coruscus]|uniref:Endonuclease/exonuclease/phosphatase domain-containing protein n=1 Tax=Mytilus coruscus TaxID=42192 RepID=A0A6J8CAB1_MYTCO|nr:unnamed protein product [Mytilus coruscus]
MIVIVTFNCNGLRDQQKRDCVFTLFNDRRYDVIFLQETHWDDVFADRINKSNTIWNGDIFYCNKNNIHNAGGVAIMIRKNIVEKSKEVQKFYGRFLHLNVDINGKNIDLFNIYAPNPLQERFDFFQNIHSKIKFLNNDVVSGDFNTSLGALDRGGKISHREDKAVCALKSIINDNVLCDVYRKRNLDVSVFSRKQIVENNLRQSRIDFHLISLSLKPFVKNIYHNDSSFSDHSFVSMILDFRNVETGPGLWILNNQLLDDEVFIENIKKIIQEEVYSDFYFSSPLTWYDNLKYRFKRFAQNNISDYEMCESDITFDEICRSVNGMKKGKTPGPDGLTCEFYCKFINEFKDIFFHVFNCIANEGQLSRSMRHSVINLIFKKKGDKNDIKSYTPITLANVDYKILARIMANRLKLTLTQIISNTQTCSVIGRDISDTVCSIINVIDLIDEEELEAYILKTDL